MTPQVPEPGDLEPFRVKARAIIQAAAKERSITLLETGIALALKDSAERIRAKFWELAAEEGLTCCGGKHMTGGGPDKAEVDAVLAAAIRGSVGEPEPRCACSHINCRGKCDCPVCVPNPPGVRESAQPAGEEE